MTFLLDVNVLIALLDSHHVFHGTAHDWLTRDQKRWATCPITENGVIRIMGHRRYPEGPGSPARAAILLTGLRTAAGHEFWPDSVSLVDNPGIIPDLIVTAAQVTDTYLLSLAVSHQAKLATFDTRLSSAAVVGGAEALQLID